MRTVSKREIPSKLRVLSTSEKIRKQNCTYNKEKMNWFRNAIANLYDIIVSAPVSTTRDALLKQLGYIRSTVAHYYNRARGQQPPQRTLKDIVEETSYTGVENIKHMYGRGKAKQGEYAGIEDIRNLSDEDDGDTELMENGDRVKAWQFRRNLNSPLTKAVMGKITPNVDMRVVVVYSFSCNIYQGNGGVTEYHKSKSTKGSLSSIVDIEAFIKQCEMQRLDLEDMPSSGMRLIYQQSGLSRLLVPFKESSYLIIYGSRSSLRTIAGLA